MFGRMEGQGLGNVRVCMGGRGGGGRRANIKVYAVIYLDQPMMSCLT